MAGLGHFADHREIQLPLGKIFSASASSSAPSPDRGVPAIAGGLAKSVYVTLSGAGHLSNQEWPEAFNAWVRAHLHVVARTPA